MKLKFIQDLEEYLQEEYGCKEKPAVDTERPPEDFEGEITVNCFRLAPQLRRAPQEIAGKVEVYCQGHADIEMVQTVKAFVNLTLDAAALFRDTVADIENIWRDAELPAEDQEKVIIEFSAPNTNKPQHLGHVRNNALGQSLVSILKKTGHEVFPVNLINDRGIHICKSMLAYQRWGNGETPASAGKKGDHFVGDYYVKFQEVFKEQIAVLRNTDPANADRTDEELFLDTEIGQAAQEMLIAWENDDPEVRALWETMNEWVIAGFQQTYERMGVYFDRVYRESETYGQGREIIRQHLEKGVFRERDDGAVVIDLDEEKLGTKVVLRKDGTSVYVTQDIGTTIIKQEDYRPDCQMWIVGDEQIFHFKVLFAILRRLGFPWAEELRHIPYGMVNLPTGKMKSREGTVVDADVLFDELAALAEQATRERYENVPDDLQERAETIGMAAVKFMLLNVNAQSAMTFDPEESVRFEGDTGPYVLYACARIASIMKKADPADFQQTPDWTVLGAPEEKDLALRCAEYGEVIRKAAVNLNPSLLTNYLLELAKAFSRFYRECSVLKADTNELRHARLALTERVHATLEDGLRTLTIRPLESM